MQARVDNHVVDRRIGELTEGWMQGHDADDVAASLKPTLQAVMDEGMTANQGGKRLRALLSLAAFDSYDTSTSPKTTDSGNPTQTAGNPEGVPQAMLDLACAIEIYQTSALIHDDIIDDSPERRGRESAHVALSRANAPRNFGTGLALMLGNMLATASADIAAHTLESPALHHADANLRTFLQMQRAVEIGQTLDLGAETISLDEPDELIDASLDVFKWKTASYTTIAPLELGLCAAGMPPEDAHRNAWDIGLPLGVAFQLADDLIDVTGKNSGKPIGGDVREAKHTVLLADALRLADEKDRGALIRMYAQPTRSDDDVRKALGLFETTGAIELSHRRIKDLWHQAESAMDNLAMTTQGREILTSACVRFIPSDLR
ncbi:polyprenyl synthetase family protein [Bifidobacterium sp. ESL0775]|uniref:polyprenyl synthetase family protein n=1 Tax=Bifidobacterium sp. ESL0775 TaxID=2983230 RepID=UPI0023F906F8|nr:polyprenyl synthetase family protein [Bifidobacterium sp. ESL0775]WEV69863.1 polyprenyl synthetase family protein [Bifidobacterium sp. ESL0775]